jgi:hypothetical protein
MKHLFNSVFSLALSICTVAHAETAEEMASACREISNAAVSNSEGKAMAKFRQTWDTGLCWGAFSAITGVSRLVDEQGVPVLPMCLPEASTRTQIVTVFVSYVRNHPEQGHLPYHHVAVNALAEAFPCP